MYIDVHCHLDKLSELTNLEEIMSKCKKNKVGLIVTAGTNIESNRKVLEISQKYSEVKAALGIYPIDALEMKDSEIDKELEFIRKNKDLISAIGEVGMDFKEGRDSEERQRESFSKFVELSIGLNKPIVIHSRKAELECIEILEKLNAKKVIMHYFSGKKGLIKRIIENGWFLSVPTAVKNSEQFQLLIKLVPLQQLLCETDSPYSHPDKEFPNDPSNILESYKMIAKIKEISLENVEKQLEKNWQMLTSS